jgi:hypothetical protein
MFGLVGFSLPGFWELWPQQLSHHELWKCIPSFSPTQGHSQEELALSLTKTLELDFWVILQQVRLLGILGIPELELLHCVHETGRDLGTSRGMLWFECSMSSSASCAERLVSSVATLRSGRTCKRWGLFGRTLNHLRCYHWKDFLWFLWGLL